MDLPSEYHNLMNQAYGLTPTDLSPLTQAKKKKVTKSGKTFSKAMSQDENHKARRKILQQSSPFDHDETNIHESTTSLTSTYSPVLLRAKNRYMKYRDHSAKSSVDNMPSKVPSNLRDRAMSCIDLRDPEHSEDIGMFRRRCKQRSSLLTKGAGSIGRRFREVHRSLTSLISAMEPPNDAAIAEDEDPPEADEIQEEGEKGDVIDIGTPAADMPVISEPSSPVSPLRREAPLSWSDVRAAYQQRRHATEKGTLSRRASRLRAIPRHLRSSTGFDAPLEDVMETIGLEKDHPEIEPTKGAKLHGGEEIGPSQFGHCQSLDAGCDATPPTTSRGRTRPQSEIIELALAPGLANQKIANSTFSLPAQIDCISDIEDDAAANQRPKDDSRLDVRKEKKRNKLTRRKAWYRQKKDGRSRSLTHIDSLDPSMMLHQEDSDRMSEPDTFSRQSEAGTHRKKKLVGHGKVASSECFSVSFDIAPSEEAAEEFVPAVKGTVLREALSHVCDRHRVDIDSVSVYLENGRTPLPLLTTETYWLGGKHLRIKVRDHDNKSPVRSKSSTSQSSAPSRKTSGSYRGMVSKRFVSSGDEICTSEMTASSGSTEGSLKVSKQSKQHTRWSGIFSNSSLKDSGSSKMEQMIQCLETYQCTGIPRLPYLVNFDGDASEEEELYSLESDWRELVDSPEQLSERRHQQQNAIWELVHTEAAYIHTLKVITDLFLSCLCNLQNCQILTEVDTEKLFSNIQEIYAANRHFWHDHVLRMLTKARRTRQPLDITEMRDGFAQFEEICHPYTRYCLDQNHSKLYCKSLTRSNGLFNGYLVWCETQKDCNRLRLVDILAMPWQRLTKYSLLLKAILKKTESVEEQSMLREMVQDVDLFVGSVDGSLRHRHEQERLSEIIARIESYDCVDTKDDELERALRPHLSLDLTSPMPGCSEVHRRYLLHEGELKLRDNVSSKVDVRCFLFTDMLLVCKPLTKKGDKVRVIRQPYVIDRLLIQEATRDASLLCVYLNEYQCATAAFTLYCPDNKYCKSWLEWVRKAQEKYREARLATINQEYVFYDDDDELEIPACALLSSRSPRGSSRTSRVPSLIHSHSSSVDNTDPSGASSVLTVQASSARAALAATEERLNLTERSASEDIPSSRLKGSLSPKSERRPMLRSVGSTPNQLSVMPHLTPAGQSLPNLSAEASQYQLSVPPHKARNPAQRGVTYPPLSPRVLRRSSAVHPTPRNPPLSRARHVMGEGGGGGGGGGGASPPPPPSSGAPQAPSLQPPLPAAADTTTSPSSGEEEADAEARTRRHSRDRLENRRYHTAGAIEDMKRQELRDSSIHKRLSWNCGQQQTPAHVANRQPQALRARNTCLSSDSVHSSSGVSSVNSLQLSIGSEFEEAMLSDNLEDALTADLDDSRTIVEATNLAQHLKLIPHISTTYISADELSCAGVSCVSSTVQNTESGVKIDISEAPDGVLSRVQITVNDDSSSATAVDSDTVDGDDGSSVPTSPAAHQWNEFEFLLSDNTIRASDV